MPAEQKYSDFHFRQVRELLLPPSIGFASGVESEHAFKLSQPRDELLKKYSLFLLRPSFQFSLVVIVL